MYIYSQTLLSVSLKEYSVIMLERGNFNGNRPIPSKCKSVIEYSVITSDL